MKLNQRFAAFSKLIEQQSERVAKKKPLKMDIPLDEFDFEGCPVKSVVKLRPTPFCIIAISEQPFFIIDLDDIETVHFERVSYGLKNFDMAIIFKDFQTVKRISSIPVEHIEQIKDFLNEIGIIFSEGQQTMNWATTLNEIRSDFQAFLDDGGWKQMQDDDEEEGGEEDPEDEDESFDLEEDEEAEEDDDESDYSDSDEEDNSSSEMEEEDLSEEGLSWEELDRQAEEDDRKAASRRQTKDAGPPNKKRAPGRK
jgi:nucleosome binding factor SPN SPT16 subunit